LTWRKPHPTAMRAARRNGAMLSVLRNDTALACLRDRAADSWCRSTGETRSRKPRGSRTAGRPWGCNAKGRVLGDAALPLRTCLQSQAAVVRSTACRAIAAQREGRSSHAQCRKASASRKTIVQIRRPQQIPVSPWGIAECRKGQCVEMVLVQHFEQLPLQRTLYEGDLTVERIMLGLLGDRCRAVARSCCRCAQPRL
jgi:hypothetical protein